MKINILLEEKKIRIRKIKNDIINILSWLEIDEIEMAMLDILSDINYWRLKRKRK